MINIEQLSHTNQHPIDIQRQARAQKAAEGFTSLFIEKMLNDQSIAKAKNSKNITPATLQTELMMNTMLSQKIAEGNNPISMEIAKKLGGKK